MTSKIVKTKIIDDIWVQKKLTNEILSVPMIIQKNFRNATNFWVKHLCFFPIK